MIKLEMGGDYVAKNVISGVGKENKPYELVIVGAKNPKEKREIKLWATPPADLHSGDNFRIDRIFSVKFNAKKYKDKWMDEVHIEAKVTPLLSYQEFEELRNTDGELPF